VISDNEKFREWLREIFKEIKDFPEEKFERFIDASIRYILSVTYSPHERLGGTLEIS